MSKFDFTLTREDMDLTTEFMMLLGDQEYFNSDDFRQLRLHERFKDPAHEIGAIFAKWKANGIAIYVGEEASEIPSNNERKVDLWRWNWSRWRFLVRTRLDYFAEPVLDKI